MNSNNISTALSQSISADLSDTITGIAEVGLDQFLDDGIFKEVPILSTVIDLYKVGHTLKERHNIKKLAKFVQALNNKVADEDQRIAYRSKICDAPHKRNQELEYILIMIDRYIEDKKPSLLAKLYLAYLDEKIDWQLFTQYSIVIDNLFVEDLQFLKKGDKQIVRQEKTASVLRLVSLGLLYEQTNTAEFEVNEDGHLIMKTPHEVTEKMYSHTEFGATFAELIEI